MKLHLLQFVKHYVLHQKVIQYFWKTKNVNQHAKGLIVYSKKKFTHDIYLDVHQRLTKFVSISGYNIRSIRNRLVTMEYRKRAIIFLDRKRFWVNAFKSYGYGHPDIERNTCFPTKEKKATKAKKHFSKETLIELTRRKLSKCKNHNFQL